MKAFGIDRVEWSYDPYGDVAYATFEHVTDAQTRQTRTGFVVTYADSDGRPVGLVVLDFSYYNGGEWLDIDATTPFKVELPILDTQRAMYG